jgi:hypothetical protein
MGETIPWKVTFPGISQTWYVPYDVGNDSLDELGRMCRGSVQLCKNNTTVMWPLSSQGMVHTLIKADNTVAAMNNLNIVTVQSLQWITINFTKKSPSTEANSCLAAHSIPCLLLPYFPVDNARVIYTNCSVNGKKRRCALYLRCALCN